MKNAYIRGEREWMGGHQGWQMIDEDQKCIGKFGMWKNRKALIKAFNERNNGEYQIAGEIKIDNYAKLRGIAPKAGWTIA